MQKPRINPGFNIFKKNQNSYFLTFAFSLRERPIELSKNLKT